MSVSDSLADVIEKAVDDEYESPYRNTRPEPITEAVEAHIAAVLDAVLAEEKSERAEHWDGLYAAGWVDATRRIRASFSLGHSR